MRVKYYASTVCYLEKENKILFLKFNKKWKEKYAPPGGKVEENETPTECIIREFKEETGLELINPKLKGVAYWNDGVEGIIFIYTANHFNGEIVESYEGKLEWIEKSDILALEQFDMNKRFTKYVFENGVFEGKFLLDSNKNVKEFNIKNI